MVTECGHGPGLVGVPKVRDVRASAARMTPNARTMARVLTIEQARSERLTAECRRRMAAAARIDDSTCAGRKAKDAAIAEIDLVLDELALTLPSAL